MYLRGSFNTRKSNMDNNKLKNPAYLFEVSWEVCNKVGGIHTVISTKPSIWKKNTAVVIF